MAYTLHWSNYASDLDVDKDVDIGRKDRYIRPEKQFSLEPVLSLQRDVLFPGAEASLKEDEPSESTGCVGHNLTAEFPLTPRMPASKPLVFARGADSSRDDLCASPVVSWENYVLKTRNHVMKANAAEKAWNRKNAAKAGPSSRSSMYDTITCLPQDRVEGTWNYRYTNHGACAILKGSGGKQLKVAVGNGNKLRIVNLKKTKASTNTVYAVDYVLEEVPDMSDSEMRGELTCDIVYQIEKVDKAGVIAVRRQKTVEFYDVDASPQKLYSVQAERANQFTAFDLHHGASLAAVTIDSSMSLQFHDIISEKSSRSISIDSLIGEKVLSKPQKYHFSINKATGVCFGGDGVLIYFYHDSKVYMYDQRSPLHAGRGSRSQLSELLNLKDRNPTIKSISDPSSLGLNLKGYDSPIEYVSCVQSAGNPYYYYVGTTSRVILMDFRVPQHPVFKSSHGLDGALSYFNVTSDNGFDVVVGGCQRTHELYCSVFDYHHHPCRLKASCGKKNPILQAYPKHLSTPLEYLECSDNVPSWVDESAFLKRRLGAWCTGIATRALTGSHNNSSIPSLLVLTSNSYGDLFYQEWVSRDILSELPAVDDEIWNLDHSNFVSSNPLKTKAVVPSQFDDSLTIDCTTLVEEAFEITKTMGSVRTSSFNIQDRFKPALESLKSIKSICSDMKEYKFYGIDDFVKVWKQRDGIPDEEINAELTASDSQQDHVVTINAENSQSEDNLDAQIKVEPPEELEYTEFSDVEEILMDHETAVENAELTDVEDSDGPTFPPQSQNSFYDSPALRSNSQPSSFFNPQGFEDSGSYSQPMPFSLSQDPGMDFSNASFSLPLREPSRSESSRIPKRRSGFL